MPIVTIAEASKSSRFIMHISLVKGTVEPSWRSPLDDCDPVCTFDHHADRDLLQVAVVVHGELRQMCLGSAIEHADDMSKRSDVGWRTGCRRSNGRVQHELGAAHHVA